MNGYADTTTNFAFEPFLPVWGIAALGVGLAALSFWIAWRDSRFADRPKLTMLLFALRTAAVGILIWILLGPTLVTTVRKLRTKSISILVDSSASMGLVDAVDGSGNVSRWAERPAMSVRTADESVASLRAIQLQLQRFARLPETTDADPARAMFARAVRGIEEAAAELRNNSARAAKDATRIIEGKVLDGLRQKSAEFTAGKSLAALDRERWLPDRLTQLALAISAIERVTDQQVKAGEETGKSDAGEQQLSRLDRVSAFLASAEASWLKDIRAKATVNRYEFGEKVIPMGAAPFEHAPKGKSLSGVTQLGGALQQVALDQTAQAVEAAILITDGGHNAGRDPRELAASLAGTALHVVPIGNTKMQRDVILHHTHAPKAVIQNDTVVIDSIVTAYDCANETLNIELVSGETVIEQQTVPITAEVFDKRLQFRCTAAALGKHTLTLRVRPLMKERTDENNSAKADVLVMEDKIHVLVADNFPRWETRYLLNLFKRDDRVVFEQLLFEPQRASGEGARSDFPTTLDDWAKYRVVILGDVLPNQLTPERQKQLRDYVSEGGGNLILVAGKDAMPAAFWNQPLGALLPVEAAAAPGNKPFYLHLGDEATMTLATQIAENPGATERAWREMSERLPIYALSEFSKPKPTTHSLIWASLSKREFNPTDASTRAFLAWHYVGAGRVVYLAAPVTYQLRYREGDTFHHRFWGQLLRWTIARDLGEGSRTVRLSTDKSRYEQGEPAQVSVRLRQLDGQPVSGASLIVSALQEGKVIQEIPVREDAGRPGSYLGTLEQLPAGPVKLQLAGDRLQSLLALENYQRPIETIVNIDPSGMLELRHPLCNLPLLREIADASGGMVVPPTGLRAALKQLNLDPEVLESVSKEPQWNRWSLLAAFIGCLALEWSLRKFLGLS